jgi:hypothetical protein
MRSWPWRTGEDSVSGESCFLEVMSEDMKHEGLQCLYIQLSSKMGATAEFIAIYETHRAMLMELQDEKAETISWLAQDKEDIMWELQELEIKLEDKRKKKGKLLSAAQSHAVSPPQAPRAPKKNLKLSVSKVTFIAIVFTGYVESEE